MPADRSAYGLHGAKLVYVAESANYLRGKLFLTSDVIEFLPAAGDISGAGTAAVPSMVELLMNNVTELIDRFIAMWNETDAERRRALIARTWMEDATFLDPVAQGEGPAGIEAIIRGVQERFPGHRLRRTTDPDAHHDRVRFCWELAPEGGAPVVSGTDFAVVGKGDRLQMVTGFFDHVSAAQSEG